MKFDPHDVFTDRRDRFIISKGHGSISMYPILADLGFFDSAMLGNVCKFGSFLGGIPDPNVPGYETINGSLGHGLGVGAGMALALKRMGKKKNTFVLSGDGELHEGASWEAVMFAAQNNLYNLILIEDNNKTCMLDYTDNVVSNGNISERLASFGWECTEVDGHNIEDMHGALLDVVDSKSGAPKAIVADTIKGRGLPGIENKPLAHIMNPSHELIDSLLR